jgi:branched-chain amino acid transport system substrate-binding protein
MSFTGRVTSMKRVGVIAVVTAVVVTLFAPAARSAPSVRGFDGKTIKIAGMGLGSNFAAADIGTKARFKRANDTNELKGIKLEYTEFADDKGDPATATSEARRLVTQEGIFAIVPNFSATNPGPYLNQQHVPYVGFAFDNTYCSQKPTTALYGFGYNGCLVPADPKVMPDSYAQLYKYVSEKTGKKHPSMVLFSNDNQSGKNSSRFGASAAQGAGFKVVYAKGAVPMVTSDYSPYVQTWMTADGGNQPDEIHCLLAVQCLEIWNALKAAGFKGTFWTSLALDLFTKPLAGTVATGFYNTAPNPGLTQMQKDLDAVSQGKPPGTFFFAAYFAADMFIQGVKNAMKKVGAKNLTPEAVQQALAKQSWEIKGLIGPTKYPASTVVPTPSCNELLTSSGGTTWDIAVPYACSYERIPIDPKFKG